MYIWLVETVYRLGPISLGEISRLWEESSLYDDNPMARTTFNRHREEIEDIFGIRIVCDRRNGWRYYIENTGELHSNTVQSWMAGTISLNNVIAESRLVHDRILLETIPSDGDNLKEAIKAMQYSRTIDIEYRKYQSTETRRYHAEQYCVKLYRRRWYVLIRYPDTREYRILSFDRIVSLSISEEPFVMDTDFDAEKFFGECYGVVRNPEIPLQKIVLRAWGKERYYMRDLPLHPSQRLLALSDDHADYEVTLRPTDDFIGHLLSRAQWLRVVSPASLADKLSATIKEMHKRYAD